MKLGPHIALSSAAGGVVWAATGEAIALPAAVAAGVLPDADHLLDYYLKYVRRDFRFVFLLFHAWEYLAVGILVYALWFTEPWMLAVLLGYATQVGADQWHNMVKWDTYLITARARRRFRSVEVLGRTDFLAYHALVNSVPFGRRLLLPWFASRMRAQPSEFRFDRVNPARARPPKRSSGGKQSRPDSSEHPATRQTQALNGLDPGARSERAPVENN